MAGLLQRSVVSFRSQGSSGLIWDDKYLLSGELVNQPVKHKQETNEKRGQPKEDMMLQPAGEGFINNCWSNREKTIQRRFNDRAAVSKVSACGLCSVINGKKGKSPRRIQYGKRAL